MNETEFEVEFEKVLAEFTQQVRDGRYAFDRGVRDATTPIIANKSSPYFPSSVALIKLAVRKLSRRRPASDAGSFPERANSVIMNWFARLVAAEWESSMKRDSVH